MQKVSVLTVLHAGAVALLGCVFFSPKGAFHFVGNSLLDGRSMQLPEAFQDSAEMMVSHLCNSGQP